MRHGHPFAALIASGGLAVAASVNLPRNDAHSCCSALEKALPGRVSYASSAAFNASLGSYWSQQQMRITPFCVVSPSSTEETATAVKTLTNLNRGDTYECKFAVRSGGHGWPSASNLQDGVTIDLSALKSVSVNADKSVTSVGAGARWSEVYLQLDALGLAVPGGRDATVGVGGLVLGGGMSYFSPRTGFVCDNILNYEIVLGSGEVINANEKDRPDLWVALRGGSNNFGIITRVDLRTFEQGKMWGGAVYYNISTAGQHQQALFNFVKNANYDEYATIIQSYGFSTTVGTVVSNNYEYSKPQANAPAFNEFLAIQPQLASTMRVTNLSDIAIEQASLSPSGLRQFTATTTFKLNLDMLNSAYQIWSANILTIANVTGLQYSWTYQPIVPAITGKAAALGGNSLGLNAADGPLVLCLNSITWTNAQDDEIVNAVGKKLMDDVDKASKKAGVYHEFKYTNYAAPWQNPLAGYGAANVGRIRQAARNYDPKQIFQKAVPGGFKISAVGGYKV